MIKGTVPNPGFGDKKPSVTKYDILESLQKNHPDINEVRPYPGAAGGATGTELKYIQSANINEILASLNISMEEINYRIVKELLESGIDISKEIIDNVLSVYRKYGNDGIKASIMLLLEGRKLDGEITDIIEKMIQTDNNMLKLDTLLKSLEEAVKEKSDNNISSLFSQLKKIFTEPENAAKIMPKPDNVYREFLNIIHSMKNSPSKPGEESDEFFDKTGMIEKGVNSLREVAQYIPYFQIPIKLKDYYTTGELYILKRRKGVNNKAAFTILLSLYTEYMGKVDTLLEFYGRNVRIAIRVDDEKVSNFINGYKDRIAGLLRNINFTAVEIQCFAGEKISFLDTMDFIGKIFETRKIIDCRV